MKIHEKKFVEYGIFSNGQIHVCGILQTKKEAKADGFGLLSIRGKTSRCNLQDGMQNVNSAVF